MMSDSDVSIVAAIDIGSTHCSYAFSHRHEFIKDPLKIRTTAWAGNRNLFTTKSPTVVLLTPGLELVTCGYEAEDTYAEMLLHEEHDGSRLFRDIVAQLVAYTNFVNDWRQCRIKDTDGRTAPVLKVFSGVFKFFHEHLLNTLRSSGVDQPDSTVRWAVGVAPSWNIAARDCLVNAAVESGISKQNLVLVLQPEAALTLHQTMASNSEVFRKGTNTMVLDLGGGTTEISIYQVTNTDTLTERHHAHWTEDMTSDAVNANFITLFNDITGGCFKCQFREEFLADYYDILREFEAKKRLVGDNESAKFTFAVPISLENVVLSETQMTFKDTIEASEFANDVTYIKPKIRIDSVVITALFVELLENIAEKIREMCSNHKVSSILMVGGFAECPLAVSAMREAFPDKAIEVVTPDASMAVLKGSVLYGHNNMQIKFIKSNTKEKSTPSIKELQTANKDNGLCVANTDNVNVDNSVSSNVTAHTGQQINTLSEPARPSDTPNTYNQKAKRSKSEACVIL